MYKQLARSTWTCARCLRQQTFQREHTKRTLVGLAAADAQESPSTPHIQFPFPAGSHASTGKDHDDRTLRQLFDSQSFWQDFRKRGSASGRTTGLLHNKYLSSPQGFQDFAQTALRKCQKIVAKVLGAQTADQYRGVVRDLDRLSDQLCRVIDLVDFIRNVHPDARIQQAAAQAHAEMFEYMNVLNTTPGLHDQLQIANSTPEIYQSWTEQEKLTAAILIKDFAQSVITGPPEQRRRFVEVSNEVIQTGQELVDEMAPKDNYIRLPSSKLNGMDPAAVKNVTRWGTSTLPTHGSYARLALRTVDDPETRRQIYMATRTASTASVQRVGRLACARAELARLSGYASFAHMALSDKMAKTPEAVSQFLDALAADNKSHVQRDLQAALSFKQSDARRSSAVASSAQQIDAWDREYYAHRLRSQLQHPNTPSVDALPNYFSLGTVMQGLSRLFDRLYGVRLVPRETLPGETWTDDVRRLDVIHESEGHIAVIYADLFSRPNKSPNPAHFTLRCSREITASEIAESLAEHTLPPDPSLTDLSLALNDAMALNTCPFPNGPPALSQLPTIGFTCDFPAPPSATTPTLLTFTDVNTLFHEAGHALHSLLGRTTLQNIAGTRCATDFAELPSILMEHFAADPAVLRLYARHWHSDDPLDVDLVATRTRRARHGVAPAETESQILLSALDQALHSRAVPSPGLAGAGAHARPWSAERTYLDVYTSHLSSVPEPRGTSWLGFFGHLHQYGAVYYSYLFDRAVAHKVWGELFAGGSGNGDGDGNSLSRERGERYREEVLRHGGGRDPWRCVAGVLGERWGWVGDGGERAMREVGRWGVGDTG